MWIWLSLLTMTAISVVVTTIQAVLTVVFRRRARFFAPGLLGQAFPHFLPGASTPLVSILKPVCGLEDELEENLISFTAVRDVEHEVILSVADGNDPALEVIERVRKRFPTAPFRVVIGGDPCLERMNRKVARLIAAEQHARGAILFISDANVRVSPDDIARTVASFDDARVGCVSNLFTGQGARSFGATIESLHLLSFVVTGNVLAAFANIPCVVGKSMAIRREVLRAIGGFDAFTAVLAEDQAIALAVTKTGYRVALSPVVVRNIVTRRSLERALDRQIRWNKIRYAFSKATYAAEFLANPLPLSLLCAVLVPRMAVVPLLVVLVRIAQVKLVAWATGANLRFTQIALVPLLDLLQWGAQFVPVFDNRVTWRGYTARIGPATALLDVERAAA